MSNEKNVNEEVVEGEELAIEAEACDEIVDVEEQGSVFNRAIGFCKKHKAVAIGAGVGLFCIGTTIVKRLFGKPESEETESIDTSYKELEESTDNE